MKQLCLFILLLKYTATEGKNTSLKGWDYNYGISVHSDSLDVSVSPGKCVVHGKVTQGYNNHPAGHVLICNQDQSKSTRSNYRGDFEIELSVSDRIIYCRNWPWGEYALQYKFLSQHRLEVRCNFEREIILWPFGRERSNVTKPVIYAYNAPGDIQLSINPRGGFSFTYPATSTGSWRFRTNPDGSVTDINSSKAYPYLFWEGPGKHLTFISNGKTLEGYLIKTDTCAAFFENVLAGYGLNEKESADFITWWAPQLVKNQYALIQFFTDDDYEKIIAEISIDPKPLSILRLYMYVALLNEPLTGFEIIQPEIPGFKREGFTIIEWGGSVLNKVQPRF